MSAAHTPTFDAGRLRNICENATQKCFSAWQGITGAGYAELNASEVIALLDAYAELKRKADSHDDLIAALEQAVARIELANAEGNPILSAWLPRARTLLLSKAKGE